MKSGICNCKWYVIGGMCLQDSQTTICLGENGCPHYQPKTEIVTLCGSTKQKEQFLEVARQYTLKGYIVLMPGVFGHTDGEVTEEEKARLDALHLQKIDMSDLVVFLLKPDGSLGESTTREFLYATQAGKEITIIK